MEDGTDRTDPETPAAERIGTAGPNGVLPRARGAPIMAAMQNPTQLPSDHIARLEELASLRGEMGISHLVERAVDHFLAEEDRRLAALAQAFRGLGAPRDEQVLVAPSSRRG